MRELTHTTVVPEEGRYVKASARHRRRLESEALTVPTYQKRNRMQIEPKLFKKSIPGARIKGIRGRNFHISHKSLFVSYEPIHKHTVRFSTAFSHRGRSHWFDCRKSKTINCGPSFLFPRQVSGDR